MMCGGINKTQQTVTETELGLLIELAVQCLLVLLLCWSSLYWERNWWELFLVPGVSPHLSCWLVLRPGCTCLVVPPLLLTWLYWTADISMRCSEWIELPLLTELNYPFPDNIDRSSSKELFLNRPTSPISFLSTTSGGWWVKRKVKAFKNHY